MRSLPLQKISKSFVKVKSKSSLNECMYIYIYKDSSRVRWGGGGCFVFYDFDEDNNHELRKGERTPEFSPPLGASSGTGCGYRQN